MDLVYPNSLNPPSLHAKTHRNRYPLSPSSHPLIRRSNRLSLIRVLAENSTNGSAIASRPSRSVAATREAELLFVGKSSAAMDQLNIERGVCVPFRKYSPDTVRKKVLKSLVLRGVEIVWNLGFYWSTLMYDWFVGRDEDVVPFRARQLRNLLCNLILSFIKASQVLANRPDIIREDYMNELCILQDDVPPFPNQANLSNPYSVKSHLKL